MTRGPRSPSGGGRGSAFNVLSVIMLGLTALACLCYTTLFFAPSLAGPFAVPVPISAAPPTSTPTVGPPTMPATWTPTITSTPTETPLPVTPSDTPEPTSTRPIATRVPTRTPSVTPGPSLTASPTRSKYPYTANVTLQPSPINPCGATYIVGTITDLSGQPVTTNGMIIHLEGDAGIDTEGKLHPGEQFRGNRVDGPSPFTGLGFGPSAWSVVINLSGTSAGVWRVWLIQGGQVSDQIEVHLQGDCVYSSAVVRFQQNH